MNQRVVAAAYRRHPRGHGGQLWATPNEGPGETFQFTLPTGATPNRSTRLDGAAPHVFVDGLESAQNGSMARYGRAYEESCRTAQAEVVERERAAGQP
jgi:hypothetical protein